MDANTVFDATSAIGSAGAGFFAAIISQIIKAKMEHDEKMITLLEQRVEIADSSADKAAAQIQDVIGHGYSVRTFAQLNSTLYAALKLEKTMMFIILFLIIGVASLNIAGNLILLGTEKLRDIGIMRAMGASPRMIRKIFMWEAMVIAGLGIVLGLLLACLLCWIIATFNIVELPGDIYYLTKVPVRMQLWDIVAVIGGSCLICFAAGLYPAVKASRVHPTDAIRYG